MKIDIELTEYQIKSIQMLLKGYGYSRALSDWNYKGGTKDRREMEELALNGIVRVGKNHSRDVTGMYHIRTEDRQKVKDALGEYLYKQNNGV